jgi:hypothetical protein
MNHHRVNQHQVNRQRILVFRDALTNLLESLEAVVQVASSDAPSQAPEPVSTAASKIHTRLASASRLAAGKFTGSEAEVPVVAGICGKIVQLDGAYVTYCRKLRANEPSVNARRGLTTAIEDARSTLA